MCVDFDTSSCHERHSIDYLKVPYILESNPHPFYSFRGLKNQKQIRITCGLDSRSWAGFWKMIELLYVPQKQYNTIIYYLYYIIFIIYYSSDSPSSLITESVCLVGKRRLKERCRLELWTNFFFYLRNRQKLVQIRFENIQYVTASCFFMKVTC